MSTLVRNVHDLLGGKMSPNGVYCGRKRTGMHYGNPASHLPDTLAPIGVASREDAIQWYSDWLDGKHPEVEPERREWILKNVPSLKDKTLYCYCSPWPCHCDVLARMADA